MQGLIPEIWLFTGMPGAGKSTVAAALGATFNRAAHIEGEALWAQIVAGRETPEADLRGEAERQYELAIRNQCLLARSYSEAGFVPLLDFVIATRHHLEAYQHYLMGARLRLIVLAPRLEVVRARDAARGGKTGDRFDYLDATLRDELADTGLWIDSSDLDVAQTVVAIRERQDEALLR